MKEILKAYTDLEMNSLDYEEALKIDKRTYNQYFSNNLNVIIMKQNKKTKTILGAVILLTLTAMTLFSHRHFINN